MSNKETLKKYAGALIKGSIVSVPLVGSLAVELLNVTIPNQRQERIEKLLNIVASRVFDINLEDLEEKFHSSAFIDIFEDVLFQSVRATSNERLEYLASVIEHGIKDKELDYLQTKRLLSILAEMNDVEVIILQSYELRHKIDNNFKKKHQTIFACEYIADSEKSPEIRERNAMLKNYKNNLISLGLIGPPRMTVKSHNESELYTTPLGYMLLKIISVTDSKEGIGNPINPLDAINSAYYALEQKEREIRKELEQEANKAKAILESEVNNLVRRVRRNF